jgi:hypothetical protein
MDEKCFRHETANNDVDYADNGFVESPGQRCQTSHGAINNPRLNRFRKKLSVQVQNTRAASNMI